MKTFGDKSLFAIEYEMDRTGEYGPGVAVFMVYINSKSVCTFKRDDVVYEFYWDIKDIVEWFEINLGRIIEEEDGFPLPVKADTAVEFYHNSCDYNSDDEDDLFEWNYTMHDWVFRHTWLSSRAGWYLANLFFRRVGDTIEISWDNTDLYRDVGIEFLNPTGVFYVGIDVLEHVVHDFVETFKRDLEETIPS